MLEVGRALPVQSSVAKSKPTWFWSSAAKYLWSPTSRFLKTLLPLIFPWPRNLDCLLSWLFTVQTRELISVHICLPINTPVSVLSITCLLTTQRFFTVSDCGGWPPTAIATSASGVLKVPSSFFASLESLYPAQSGFHT